MSLKLYTGVEFKKLYCGKKFFKLTNRTEIHNDFEYKDGLNEESFKYIDDFRGLYFCEKNKLHLWIWYNGYVMYNIREVNLPDDSLIFVEDNCFRTNKFILGDKKSIVENEHLLSVIKKKCNFKLKTLYEIDSIFY